ncbi:regulatory associated protein of mTOR [Trypanosoma grayi]|uniref:regulatory associated protein of mTOR n=1 Tax=Trypanosoma grayi TaxID=71804 RepID=UPI0004F472E3|nr:regulatory associated protein of mTOR [Trypanosoma grayi]KEG14191.1 regulatory associated protein of mTOR [Trypanosoma grayi]
MLSRRRVGVAPTTSATVEERLAVFAPHHLPALLTGLDVDDVAEMGPEDFVLLERPARQKVKSIQAILILCLNIGSDPPDYPRIEPCARLECWTDPHVAQMAYFAAEGASESIAETLEQQYRSQLRETNFKRAVEVHLDEAKQMMMATRRKADKGKVLLHYNGHGMPCATSIGEIWLFDKNRTHYVPLNIAEIAQLLDSPTLYVLDCNSAGSVLEYWCAERLHETRPHDMLICACSAGCFLPLNPQLPADVLTSCLTTPLQMALEWYVSYSHRKHLLPHVTADMVRRIPGDLTDRNSPLGELSWILVAVTDTVAWCTSPPPQFYQLFRQDTMTKALFRNFLLADRLLREVGCVPVSYPPISEDAHLHHAWDLWDYTLENVICQLPDLLTPELTVNPNYTYQSSSFFMDQLMAFEVWVESGDLSAQPEELPSVLLALTQISYRVPALTLLVKYLDSGAIAGKRAILCGVLPYASKLLIQTPEVFLIVSVLWMQVVRADMAQGTSELHKSQLDKYFIRLLQLDEESTKVEPVEDGRTVASYVSGSANLRTNGSATLPADANANGSGGGNTPTAETHYYLMKEVDLHRCKAMACYVLCQLLKRGGEYQCVACWNSQLFNAAFSCLSSPNAEVRSWSCLVLAQLFLGLRHAKSFASQECTTRLDLFTRLLQDKSPIVRSSCVTLLASLVGFRVDKLPVEQQIRRVQMEKSLLIRLRNFIFDASMSVREELIFFACQVLFHYEGVESSLRSATASGNRFMEYIQYVGRNSPEWAVDEPGVHIKSELSASRPTVNSRFDHAVVFTFGFLPRDDPAPPPTELDLAAIDPGVLVVLEGMVHDASVMLFTLYQTCDTGKVAAALNALANRSPPQTHRFANEALRSMSRVVSTDSSYFTSEADRARSTRNADSMRQLVLDMQDRKLEPSLLPSHKTRGLCTDIGVAAAEGGGGGAAVSTTTRHQVLPSLLPGDQVICAALRALEPAVIVATKNQRIYHTSYETYSAQAQVHSFSVRLAAPLHDVLVINDLSEQAGLLLVNKRGGFSLVKDCWEETQGVPTEVATFSACPPKQTLDIKSVYRSYNANLFYGGSIGSSGGTEIHLLSLDEEQVIQRLEVSGDPVLTSLAAHTTGRAVFAGCSDGVVRYYDDRQKQGFLGAVGMLRRKQNASMSSFSSTPPTSSSSLDAIVGAGPVEAGSAALTIATASRSAVRLYDSRKISEPTLEVDVATLCGGHGGWSHVTRSTFITAFATGVHTGLLGALLSDGSYIALNVRGRPLLSKTISVSNAQGALLPGSCVVHPLRPLMTVGGEIMLMQ